MCGAEDLSTLTVRRTVVAICTTESSESFLNTKRDAECRTCEGH